MLRYSPFSVSDSQWVSGCPILYPQLVALSRSIRTILLLLVSFSSSHVLWVYFVLMHAQSFFLTLPLQLSVCQPTAHTWSKVQPYLYLPTFQESTGMDFDLPVTLASNPRDLNISWNRYRLWGQHCLVIYCLDYCNLHLGPPLLPVGPVIASWDHIGQINISFIT